MKSAKRRRVDVNLDELDRVLDGARQAPLSEADCDKLKSALHALAAMLARPRNTEKTSAVLEEPVILSGEHSIDERLRRFGEPDGAIVLSRRVAHPCQHLAL